jgi:hypothetical protein
MILVEALRRRLRHSKVGVRASPEDTALSMFEQLVTSTAVQPRDKH